MLPADREIKTQFPVYLETTELTNYNSKEQIMNNPAVGRRLFLERGMKTKDSALPFFTLAVVAAIVCLSQPLGKEDADLVAHPAKLAGAKFTAARATEDLSEKPAPAIQAAYGKLPMSFEKNVGQTNSRTKFLARGSGYTLLLKPTEAVLVLRQPAARAHGEIMRAKHSIAERETLEPAVAEVLQMKLVGSNPAASVVGLDPLPGKSNYFIGNDPRKWRTDVTNYARVRYRKIYPGVDLIYYGKQRQLEWDFVLTPGADFRSIRFAFEGAKKLSLDARGNLLLDTAGGEVVLNPPRVHQEGGESTKIIPAGYVLADNDQISFELGAYDAERALIIDPVLSYSTYLGGHGWDEAWGIAVDSSGSAYVTGQAGSRDFPTKNPLPAPNNALRGGDAFVTKLSPTGDALVYSTYLGGSSNEDGLGIAVDASGSAYVTGWTFSPDFPIRNPLPAPNNASRGTVDAFVTKLSPTGNALVYSTYLGGTDEDRGTSIAVDSSGSAYVTGFTSSSDFPTKNPLPAPNNALQGAADAFVTKLSPTGNALVYSTFLGGTGGTPFLGFYEDEWGSGIAVDASGSAYVTGSTSSADFPTKNPLPAPNNALQGGRDAFVTKLSPIGNALVYSTFLGGTGNFIFTDDEWGTGIAVDASGSAYVTGSTSSVDFPTKNPLPAPNNALQGGENAFVTKLTPAGNALAFSTFLGGPGGDLGYGIAVDASGSAYVTGWAFSSDFPTKPLTLSNALWVGGDAFITKFSSAGNALVYSTLLGGSSTDRGTSIAIDAARSAYVTGSTESADFPTKNPLPAPNNAFHGGADAFVAKLSEVPEGKCVSWAGFNLFLCLNRPEIDPCAGQPFGTSCLPLVSHPQVCSFVNCPPCLTMGRWPCPPFELLFDNRGNDLRLNLVTQNGEPAGAIENLKEPLRVGEQTFNQRIRFRAQPGRFYLLEVSMGPKTRMEVGYRVEMLLRPDRSEAGAQKPIRR
jgi:hypothetical protein